MSRHIFFLVLFSRRLCVVQDDLLYQNLPFCWDPWLLKNLNTVDKATECGVETSLARVMVLPRSVVKAYVSANEREMW
jgi:hypothetical protein